MNQDNPNGFVESERGIILNESLLEERRSPAESAPKPPKKHEKKIVGFLLFLLVAGAVAFAATQIDYTAISDTIAGNGYEASGDLARIIDELQLTDEGMRILKATRPELQDGETFNANCTYVKEGVVTLGCHTNGRIYVYNVTNSKLDGIRESVLAHELLHAVWARTSDDEKAELSAELEAAYSSSKEVQKSMESYAEDKNVNELHSYVGQSVRPDLLSEKLRVHYAKYFSDHAAVVAFHEKSNAPFEELQQRIDELSDTIAEHRKAYEPLYKTYMDAYNEYKQKNKAFQDCSRQINCFESYAAKEKQYNELSDSYNLAMELYEKTKSYADELNSLISEYNGLVIKSTDLQNSINSRSDEKPSNPKSN